MIYFDNSATSFPKPRSVLRAVSKYTARLAGNAGRSGHTLSIKSAEILYRARESVARHILFDKPERVVFTQNATYALNMAIKGLITEPCHVITSNMEHNSVLRPLIALKEKGVSFSAFDASLSPDISIPPLIRPNTKFIVCTAVSNVNGAEIDIYKLSKVAAENGLGLILDLSQLLGHREIDASRLHFSALCAPGHKGLMGLMGAGFAVFSDTCSPTPIFEGGSGYDSLNEGMPSQLPERVEAGTLSAPAIVGMAKGIEYIEKCGTECVGRHLAALCNYSTALLSKMPKIKLIGSGNGIVAFNVADIPSATVADFLDKHGICVRGGLHCAPMAHKTLNTLEQGAVRVSYSMFNTLGEVDKLYRLLKNEYK